MEISFYLCKSYHFGKFEAKENMNGLIRQYIPKGTDFSGITDVFVVWVKNKLKTDSDRGLVISHQMRDLIYY